MKRHTLGPPAVLPTGIIALDLALGRGGLPRGEIIEIYGQPSSGKTTLALLIAAEAQMMGLTCLYLDLEKGLTPAYARRCGVSPEKLLIGSPEHGEDALELAYQAVHGGGVQVVVIDTIAALCPRRQHILPTAVPAGRELNTLLTPALRRLKWLCRARQASLICLNQLRTRLRTGYGQPETSPGGMVLKIQAAVRIRLDRIPAHPQSDHSPGEPIQASLEKNQGDRIRSVFFNIVYNRGVNREEQLISLGYQQNILSRVGSQYLYRGRSLGSTPAEVQELLRTDRKLRLNLRSELYQKLLPISQE
jgi:recombination protein RecA